MKKGVSMKVMIKTFLVAGLLFLAACSSVNGSAQGGGSEYGTGGRVKVGVPF